MPHQSSGKNINQSHETVNIFVGLPNISTTELDHACGLMFAHKILTISKLVFDNISFFFPLTKWQMLGRWSKFFLLSRVQE